jgi:peptide chain release factor subunit 1
MTGTGDVMNGRELHEMFSRPEKPYRSTLSVYLDVDQSRPSNLNRGVETQLKNLIANVRPTIHDAAELERFSLAAHRITDFVSAYQPQARGLGLFFDVSDGFFCDVEFDIPIQREAHWDREFYLQPLVNALDQFETYGVVMLDRQNLRLFTVFLGHIEEHVREGFGPDRVRHIKTSGTDHIGSASRIQRKADENVRLNLKHVVKMVDWLVESRHINRLILAGTQEITVELRNLLPKRLAMRIIGQVDIGIDDLPSDVLASTIHIAEEYERETEVQKVNEVVTTAAKTERSVAGLGHTLKAVNSDRVWELVYCQDFRAPGFECERCGGLFSTEKTSCQYCGGNLQAVNDVVERAVEHALRNGAKVDVVTGEAAASLATSGGIAAFLKARMGTLQV